MDRKITEALEACRPHHDDMNMTEMDSVARAVKTDSNFRKFAESLRSLDVKITSEIQNVSVPEGLHDRLLNALKTHETVATSTIENHISLSKRTKLTTDRRQWMFAGIGLAGMAAALAIAFAGILSLFETESRDQLDGWATGLHQGILEVDKWDDVSSSTATIIRPGDFKTIPIGHKRIGDADVFVFKGGKTFLLVKRANASSDIPTSPPDPIDLSDGWWYGLWRSNDQVFAVYVQGTERDYFDLVNSSAAPMA